MSDNPNSSSFPQLVPGAVFAKQFKLIKPIGRGGFGEVWKAWDIPGCRNVALKFIGSDIRDDIFAFLEEGLGVFKNFLDTQCLNHQHICPIYGLLPSDYGPFIFMKWLDGESLRSRQHKYLRQEKLIPQDQVHKVLLDIAEALDYAHSRGIVHRDVKPDNIFIERFKDTEDAVLLDFGIAEVIQETLLRTSRSRSQSSTGDHFGGTFPYMAPEQWRGSHHLNGRTDQYALAVVAYELLSGKLPFDIPYPEILRQAVLNEIPEEIDGISPVANSALQMALSKKKEERFVNCREFVHSLELTATTITTVATPPNTPESQNELGSRYYTGKGVEQNYTKAAHYFLKAAAQGNAKAQYNLGLCFDRGHGKPQDHNKAAEWFQKAAGQGHAKAQYNLGLCFDRGLGKPQDYNKAAEWFQKAAEQGYDKAQLSLGLCYKFGHGRPQNLNKAAEWFQKAAEQGHEEAQYRLGLCYEHGNGVLQDHNKAAEWYQKAAEQGHEEAKDALNRLLGK